MTPTDGVRAFFATHGETVRADASFPCCRNHHFVGRRDQSRDLPVRPTCYNGKAYTPSNQMTAGRTNYGANNNIRVLRYADVLLMNAEAK